MSRCAARSTALAARLPAAALGRLLRHDSPAVRAAARRCIGRGVPPEVLTVLTDLLNDLTEPVRFAAAWALARAGRAEGRAVLLALLAGESSLEAIEAAMHIADADADVIVALGRLARRDPARGRAPVITVLEEIDDPRAVRLKRTLER